MSTADGERRTAIIRLADALDRLPRDGTPFAELMRHGTLSVEIFAPRGTDTQQPHTRDELYVVTRGTAEFVYGSRRAPVSAGDFLFVPAHLPHRFERMSGDLTLWVMFYGPEDGERT